MNKREQEQFAAFFQEIYETEQMLDFIKKKIEESKNYDPNLLFDLISQRGEQITIQRMRSYLEDKVAVNEREIYEIFERFDWSRQGTISRQDFLNEITPFGEHQKGGNGKTGSLTSQIEGHFISLIVEILNRFRIIEVARKQIKYIQPYDAFEEIDHLKKGYIGIGELRRLFYENDFNVNESQLYYLLHGLRRRCYRDINLQVFCENLDPLEFGEYAAYQNEMDKEKEQDYLNRSRNEEETMKRSRVQAQRIEHEFQKAERKRQAELQRQLELEDRFNAEILNHEEEKERQVRRALLQEDKNIRHNVAAGQDILQQQHIRNVQERIENQYLNSRRIREEEANAILAESALRREQELERSRRAIERERQLLYMQESEKERAILRQVAVEKELEMSKRRIIEQSRKRYEEQALQKIENESRKRYEAELSRKRVDEELSRKRYDDELSRKRYDEELVRKKYDYQELLNRRYEDELPKKRIEDRGYQQLVENSRKKIQESRRISEESRRIQEQSRKRYYQDSLKSRYERQLQLQKLRAREDLHDRMSQLRSPQYQKQLQRTRYEIQQRRSRLAGQETKGTFR